MQEICSIFQQISFVLSKLEMFVPAYGCYGRDWAWARPVLVVILMLHLICWAEAKVDPQLWDPDRSIAEAESKPVLSWDPEGEKQTTVFFQNYLLIIYRFVSMSRNALLFLKRDINLTSGLYGHAWLRELGKCPDSKSCSLQYRRSLVLTFKTVLLLILSTAHIFILFFF